jgi:hypothetical protein
MADTRKKRTKATTEMGRQLMQRERQRLAKEQALLGEQLAQEATAWREAQRPIEKAPKVQVGINRSVVRRVAAVLSTEGVNVPIKCVAAEHNQQMSAWTDFERIAIRFVPHEDVRLLAAVLRGLLYHEGGHCRWTVPFRDLAQEAGIHIGPLDARTRALHTAWNVLEDQRMETAVVSDSPRKAAYLTPLIMTEHVSTVDKMAANWPLLVWRRYLPDRIRVEARRMFIARHDLVGMNGTAIADELDRIVTEYVMATDAVTMWSCVVEMLAVLQACQPLAADMTDAGHDHQRTRQLPDDFQGLTIPVDPSMIDNDAAPMDEDEDHDDPTDSSELSEHELEHLVEILIAAWHAPESLIEVAYVLPNSPQPAPADGGDEDEDDDFKGGAGSLLDEDDDKAEAPSKSQDEDEDEGDEEADEDVDEDAEGMDGVDDVPASDGEVDQDELDDDDDDADEDEEAGESDDDDHGAGEHGTHADEPGKDEFTQEDLEELLQEAEAERYEQHDLDADMDAFHDATDNGATDLDTYDSGIEQNPVLIAQAESLAQDIEDAFHAHTMDRAPAWVEQQRRGVLNVGRYATRARGDVEFFRQWTEDDMPGFDIAVSVLLDYSGSMSSHTTQLAQAGYACKMACQKLEIPCTVVLWDTEALTLWDANEQAEMMPTIVANGGTVPDMALADLDNQRCDRAKHLVLIMTDGQWQGRWSNNQGTLAWYKDDGRSIIGFGYGNQGLANSLMGKGCDEAFAISDLLDIPRYLEEALLDMA